ncbi:MAG: hypothetical protein AAB438_01565 [Patescibacteria group bacterium]
MAKINYKFSFSVLFFFLFYFFCFSFPVYGLEIISTEDVSVNAVVGSTPLVDGGGSPNPLYIPETAVRFSGIAYPYAPVYLLKEGVVQDKVFSNSSGYFSVTLKEEYSSTVLYTLFAVDLFGNRSLLLNYPIVVYQGYLTHLSGIRFAPTIVTNKVEVHPYDYLTVSGYATPSEDLEIFVIDKNNNKKKYEFNAKIDGTYKLTFPMLNYSLGEYVVYVKYINDKRISKLLKFKVAEEPKSDNGDTKDIPGDCNFDKRIDLVDFSILAYWYKKPNPPVCLDTNKDKIINLVDFSILAFYWTGRYE